MAAEELVEYVDRDGTVLEVVSRAELRRRNLRHRSVYIVVTNSNDEVVVHQRAHWKDVYPGAWDVAFGGIVDPGESWTDAAARELLEEAGIEADLQEVNADVWADDEIEVVGRVFHAVHDGPYPCPDGEVVEVRTVPRAELADFSATNAHCPDSVDLAGRFLGLRA